MHTIKLSINSSIYEHIMFFLKSLPKNMVNIEIETNHDKNTETKSLRGVFQNYADPQKQCLEDEAWKSHVVEKYKSSMND